MNVELIGNHHFERLENIIRDYFYNPELYESIVDENFASEHSEEKCPIKRIEILRNYYNKDNTFLIINPILALSIGEHFCRIVLESHPDICAMMKKNEFRNEQYNMCDRMFGINIYVDNTVKITTENPKFKFALDHEDAFIFSEDEKRFIKLPKFGNGLIRKE